MKGSQMTIAAVDLRREVTSTSPATGMTAGFELITPEVAAQMLAQFPGNRPTQRRQLERLSAALREGRFYVTNQGIGIDRNGKTIDGYHRLKSIVNTGIPTWMLVVRGLDPQVFGCVDTNIVRSAMHTLAVWGAKLPGDQAACIKVLKAYALAQQTGSDLWSVMPKARIENHEVYAWVLEHTELAEWINPARRMTKVSKPLTSRAGVAAALYLASRDNRTAVDDYLKAFFTLEGVRASDPPIVLARRQSTVEGVRITSGEAGQATSFMLTAVSLMAWIKKDGQGSKVTKSTGLPNFRTVNLPTPLRVATPLREG
jgi:hypothetical protein